jgi:hypothetical protein
VAPWVATFLDGPLTDHEHDRAFAVGPVWHTIILAPIRVEQHGWTIVGGDGIPEYGEPREAWDGEVTYALDHVVDDVAYYASETRDARR